VPRARDGDHVKVEDHTWASPALGHDMTLRVYGHDGRGVLAFPSQAGRFWDFEGWGMVDAVAGFIDAGRMRLVTVDGIDWQSWTNWDAHPADRARRHGAYDGYLSAEVVPFVRELTGRETAWATGCSMGAYHAANAIFRHPDAFDGLIAISGLYQLHDFIGDYMDDGVYFNSPLHYLPGLSDPWYLDRLRQSKIVFVVGQGAWEEPMIEDTRAMERVLAERQIPAVVDFWGHDVNHDWPWWRQMLPYYLERLGV
jgi:esterase/lipase superfamily enzyme